jgi:hypothetical protein
MTEAFELVRTLMNELTLPGYGNAFFLFDVSDFSYGFVKL